MNPFDYNFSPSTQMVLHMNQVRQKARELAALILTIPAGRERSLAMTHLEEVAMWANKAISHGVSGMMQVATVPEFVSGPDAVQATATVPISNDPPNPPEESV